MRAAGAQTKGVVKAAHAHAASASADFVGGGDSVPFEDLDLGKGRRLRPALLSFLKAKGFTHASPIQQIVLPIFIANKDVAVEACTGSGKTLAYVLPCFEKLIHVWSQPSLPVHVPAAFNGLCISAVVFAPTRELIQQISVVVSEVLEHCKQQSTPDRRLFNAMACVEMFGGRKPSCDRTRVVQSAKSIMRYLQQDSVAAKQEDIPTESEGSEALKPIGILLATPGRLRSQLLEGPESTLRKERDWTFKTVEMVVLDEADRLYADSNFEEQMRVCLSFFPKQRRTGLFSATLTSENKMFMKCGLRMPVMVKLTIEKQAAALAAPPAPEETTPTTDIRFSDDEESEYEDEEENVIRGLDASEAETTDDEQEVEETIQHLVPVGLRNYVICAEQDERLAVMFRILQTIEYFKVLVFVPTCSSTDFTYLVLSEMLKDTEKVKYRFNKLHGQMDRAHRNRALAMFAAPVVKTDISGPKCVQVMVASDLAARGIDFAGIDLIIQLDAPNNPSQTFHRIGRTARAGAHGQTVLFLSKSEASFIPFIEKKGIQLTPLEDDAALFEALNVPIRSMKPSTSEPWRACLPSEKEEFIARVRTRVLLRDRFWLEKAKDAFVSHLRSYKEHDLKFIFQFKDLDIGGLAYRYALFSLPRVKEILGRRIPNFVSTDVALEEIGFVNEKNKVFFDQLMEKRAASKQNREAKAESLKLKKLELEFSKRSKSARKKRKRQMGIEEATGIYDDFKAIKRTQKKLRLLRQKGLRAGEFDLDSD